MSPELQKQLADMLASLTTSVKDATAWTAAQIPPLIQEKITLGRIEETAWALIGLLLLISLAFTIPAVFAWSRKAAAQMHKYNLRETPATEPDGTYEVVRTVIIGGYSVAALVVGITNTLGNAHELFLVWFAPRLYIVEWLASLVKK